MKTYDTFIMGPVSRDIIITHTGEKSELTGGAVVQSAYAALAGGNRTGVLTKTAPEDRHLLGVFNLPPGDVFFALSKKTTAIKNEYHSADHEKRRCTALGIADPFTAEDIPAVSAHIYHLAGLIAGDFEGELIQHLSKRGKVAVDVQGFLRFAENGELIFRDWAQKREVLPYITYLKTDAAEAEVLTGQTDREEAARVLLGWGAGEVMITHNTEVIALSGESFYRFPLRPRNLSGRTGRGDTCFSAYITERNRRGMEASLLYAAACVSLKMETPGPFQGSRADVEAYLRNFY